MTEIFCTEKQWKPQWTLGALNLCNYCEEMDWLMEFRGEDVTFTCSWTKRDSRCLNSYERPQMIIEVKERIF